MFWSLPSPLPPQTMLKAPAMILGVKGPFKSTLHRGWRGNARICGVIAKVSQDVWPGLSENPPFNKNLDKVAKLEYLFHILEEITLRRIVRSSVIPLAVWYCFCGDVVTGSSCLFIPRCHCFARVIHIAEVVTAQRFHRRVFCAADKLTTAANTFNFNIAGLIRS